MFVWIGTRERRRTASEVVVATRDYEEFHRTTDTPTFSSCHEIKNSRFSCCLNNYILQLGGRDWERDSVDIIHYAWKCCMKNAFKLKILRQICAEISNIANWIYFSVVSELIIKAHKHLLWKSFIGQKQRNFSHANSRHKRKAVIFMGFLKLNS